MDPPDHHPEEDWVCHCLAACPCLSSRLGLDLSSSASVAVGLWLFLAGCPCAWALPVWEAVSAGKLDFQPFIVSQSVPSSAFCNGSGPCSLAVLSVLSWGGIGQNRLGISQARCTMQDRPLHAGITATISFQWR